VITGHIVGHRACNIARGRRYDVFWELSLPLAREAPSFPRSVISSGEPKSVKHCLEAFFAGEKLEVRRGVTYPNPNPKSTPSASPMLQRHARFW